jgi:hypothetical protein
MLASGAQWYCCRTATAAQLSEWKPLLLSPWEQPVTDPDHVTWHSEVLRQWRRTGRGGGSVSAPEGSRGLAIRNAWRQHSSYTGEN